MGFDDEAPSASDFSAPAVATQPGFPVPSRGVAKPEDSVHPLTRQWASRIGNRAVRDAFLAHPIEDYTSSHELSVWTGTWNTNGKRPPPGLDISPWLDAAASKPDIVVVGFQEIVPLTPGKVLAVEDEKATREWEAIIERALHEGGGTPGASSSTAGWASFDGDDAGEAAGGAWTSFDAASSEDGRRSGGGGGGGDTAGGGSKASAGSTASPSRRYVRLACKQLVGVYITVWATTEAASHVRDVRVATVSTGFNLGVGALQVATLGNKGGAAVWLKIYNTPALFVCSHLSAGSKPDDANKRSQDYHDIVSKLSFPAPPAASSDGAAIERSASVKDAFACVWIGDLNYRLNLPDDTVRDAIAGGTHARLLGADQLVLEQAAGRAFVGWTEAPVTFLPTYKYRPGTNQYSGGGDGRRRRRRGFRRVKVSKKEEKKKRTPRVRSDPVAGLGHNPALVRPVRAGAVGSQAGSIEIFNRRQGAATREAAGGAAGAQAPDGLSGDGVAAQVHAGEPRRGRRRVTVRGTKDVFLQARQRRRRRRQLALCPRGGRFPRRRRRVPGLDRA